MGWGGLDMTLGRLHKGHEPPSTSSPIEIHTQCNPPFSSTLCRYIGASCSYRSSMVGVSLNDNSTAGREDI